MKDQSKIQLCESCGCFLFIGKTMKCANGHDIDISKLTREDVVPFYRMLIEADPMNDVVPAFNAKIIAKWSDSALIFIKDKAWKQIASNEIPTNFVFDL